MQSPVDQQKAHQFAGKLVDIYAGCVLTQLVDVGYETGLFEAARGPGTSHEIASRAGLNERYVREWLGAMTTGGIFTYDPPSQRYTFPPEHAMFFTGHTARNAAPMSKMLNHFGKHLAKLTDCFRHGGGIPYAAFRPEFTNAMDDGWRRIYDERLINGFLSSVPAATEQLKAGIRVADIGCGTGHAINLMAREYPNSTFVGYDIANDAIARATAEAAAMGVVNASFATVDVLALPTEPPFDLITAFDAIHDQAHPAAVLRRVHEALAPDGIFFMVDFKFSSRVENNIGNPFAPLYYGISTMHCMTVSLAEGGAGLGTVWGIERAQQMLSEAGFTHIDVLDSPRPQNCIYVCQK